jgi:osmotically-inducible protein OsmY
MMARDYEDLQNLDQLDDREIRDLVRERLAGHNGLDIDDIVVDVRNGAIALSGRVGTESERRIAEHILTDVLGVEEFTNDIVIDPIRRAVNGSQWSVFGVPRDAGASRGRP